MAVMHGANAPLMKTMVEQQMERERNIEAGGAISNENSSSEL